MGKKKGTKAYKVVTGYETDFYGYSTDIEIAKYFFNKADAEAEYKKGEYPYEQTVIYETLEDGRVMKSTTGIQFYERELRDARENERVVKETEILNAYRMEEIEIY